MDAYVFIRNADKGALEALGAKESVHFVAPITGPYLALAVVRVESLPDLEKLVLEDFHGAGVRETETAISLMPEPANIKWGPPPHLVAFVRIWVEPGKVEQVLAAASERKWPAAVVAADFDILLEVGGETFEDVARTLVQEVHRLPGIVRTASSFAVGAR